MKTYYRYEDRLTTGGIVVNCYEYSVIKETPKGVWIDIFGHKRFVKEDARKRYACPTKEEALISFQARKKRQIKLLTKQLENAQRALELSDNPQEVFGIDATH